MHCWSLKVSVETKLLLAPSCILWRVAASKRSRATHSTHVPATICCACVISWGYLLPWNKNTAWPHVRSFKLPRQGHDALGYSSYEGCCIYRRLSSTVFRLPDMKISYLAGTCHGQEEDVWLRLSRYADKQNTNNSQPCIVAPHVSS